MSSRPPSGDPSPPPDPSPGDSTADRDNGLAALIRDRGAVLIDALERHLPGARDHAEATGAYAFAVAVELEGGRGRSELAREVAKLHDVGKVYLPVEVLTRDPAALDASERAQLDAHHEAGYRLARGAGIPERACGWILRFRERFDGAGPEGLNADRIPIESRIARVACACHEALAEADGGDRRTAATAALRERAGGELDPRVVDALATVLGRAGPG